MLVLCCSHCSHGGNRALSFVPCTATIEGKGRGSELLRHCPIRRAAFLWQVRTRNIGYSAALCLYADANEYWPRWPSGTQGNY